MIRFLIFFFPGWKYSLLLFIAFFIIILGAIGIGVGTHFYNQESTEEKHGRFGVIFDAGGSGTRMYIYEYKNNGQYLQTFKEDCEGKTNIIDPLHTILCIKFNHPVR